MRRVALLLLTLLAASGCSPKDFTITLVDDLVVSAHSGPKPQSKVYLCDGTWWMVMPTTEGTKLWRLDRRTWQAAVTLSDWKASYADVRLKDTIAHVLLMQGENAQILSVTHPTDQLRQTAPQATKPVTVPLERGVEAVTIDLDGDGRMWMAYDARTDIRVRWADAPYEKWSEPLTIASDISRDDICAITAIPDGSVAVLWSNQIARRYGFRTHAKGADPNDWSRDEVPAAESAIEDVGDGMADDHLNFAVASDGTVYAAVKTGYDTPKYPRVSMLVRRPGGQWDTLYNVDEEGSRGIVLLNEQAGTVTVIYTSYRDKTIVCKTSPAKKIRFGPRQILLPVNANNVSSTKQNYAGDGVILSTEGKVLRTVRLAD